MLCSPENSRNYQIFDLLLILCRKSKISAFNLTAIKMNLNIFSSKPFPSRSARGINGCLVTPIPGRFYANGLSLVLLQFCESIIRFENEFKKR